jgi:hypothetical protein
MNQALYAHMNNKRKMEKKKMYTHMHMQESFKLGIHKYQFKYA